MKSFSMIHLLLFIILILAYQCATSQDYVVINTGDTLRGEVRPMMYGVEKRVQLKGPGKQKTIYPIFKILAFRFRDETYQPVKGPNGYTYMKLLKPGYLSLYAFQLPNQSTFDGLYLARKDGTGLEVPNLVFKKYMKNFLEDCPSVAQKIDDGDLGKKELAQIIDEYNLCIEGNTIDHAKVIATQTEQKKILSAWDVLADKVSAQPDFENKETVLEMIGEIKDKISRSEKVPNFVIEGLKENLRDDVFTVELENALKELN